jgi:hypothetical protein
MRPTTARSTLLLILGNLPTSIGCGAQTPLSMIRAFREASQRCFGRGHSILIVSSPSGTHASTFATPLRRIIVCRRRVKRTLPCCCESYRVVAPRHATHASRRSAGRSARTTPGAAWRSCRARVRDILRRPHVRQRPMCTRNGRACGRTTGNSSCTWSARRVSCTAPPQRGDTYPAMARQSFRRSPQGDADDHGRPWRRSARRPAGRGCGVGTPLENGAAWRCPRVGRRPTRGLAVRFHATFESDALECRGNMVAAKTLPTRQTQ